MALVFAVSPTYQRVTGLGRRTRQEIAKWNQMTALNFQTGGRHQTSPASLPGIYRMEIPRDAFWFAIDRGMSLNENIHYFYFNLYASDFPSNLFGKMVSDF